MSKFLPILFLIPLLVYGANEDDVRKIEQQDNNAWGEPSSFNQPHTEEKPIRSDPAPAPEVNKTLKLEPRLRPIEAEEFRVKPVLKSTSGKVFLFEDSANNEPRPGKVLLLKKDGEDIAAVRVLRNRDGKFIAKLVLRMKEIEVGTEYRALKKLGDKITEKLQKQAQLLDGSIRDEDLAKEIDANDVELDRGIAKPAKKVKKNKTSDLDLSKLEITEDDLADHSSDFSKNEDNDIEPYNNSLSMQMGLLANGKTDGARGLYTAVGIRYGYTFARRIIFSSPSTQDQLGFELGAFFYKITGYETVNDEITVYPFLFNARYSVFLNEWFSVFGYGGIVKNNVNVSQGTVASGTGNLSKTRPMAGLGFALKLGPGWSVRADAGIDMFAFGAVLKF